MSDSLQAMDDTMAEVTDDSCTVAFIEIVPLDPTSDHSRTSEFIDQVIEVKPDDLQEMKPEESADECDIGDSHYCVKHELADEWETENPSFSIKVSFCMQVMFAVVALK